MLIVQILLWIILAPVVLAVVTVLVALLLPVNFWGRVEGHLVGDAVDWYLAATHARWELALTVAGRVLHLRLAGVGKRVTSREAELIGFSLRGKRQRRPGHSGPGGTKKPRKRAWRPKAGDIPVLWHEGRRLLRQIWAHLRLRLTGEVIMGLGDPALTGSALGVIGAVGWPPGLRIYPDFLDPHVEGWVELRGRTRGIEMLVVIIAALLRPAVRRLWWRHIKTKPVPGGAGMRR